MLEHSRLYYYLTVNAASYLSCFSKNLNESKKLRVNIYSLTAKRNVP